MLFDGLINLLFNFLEGFLNLLPFSDIELDFSIVKPFIDIISAAAYFIPWKLVWPILGIIILLLVYRVVVAFLRMLWSILPFT